MKIENNVEYEKLTQTQNKLQAALDNLNHENATLTNELKASLWDILEESIGRIHDAREKYDESRITRYKTVRQ